MPEPEDGAPRRTADELRRIARYQRWIIGIMLAQLALWVGYILIAAARGADVHAGLRLPTIITFALGGVGGIYTFLLYWTIRGPFAAVVMGLGAVPPCIGLLVLLTVNGAATAVLRANGVRVWLLGGAIEGDIPDWEGGDEEEEGW
jgi:hypothetical protein